MDSLVPASKISDMPTGWICGQTARDFVVTKTGMNGSMNIQESEEFKTSKFYCKTDFDMTEIKKEESEYVPLPKFYKFKSKEERERILYKRERRKAAVAATSSSRPLLSTSLPPASISSATTARNPTTRTGKC